MAGIGLDASVTLVVKTPSRTVDDFQVSCALDWTVGKLKKHLSDVYPSKPASKQQRLIYSGQLLLDHQTVKDFLREPIEDNFHTLHLVCPPGPSTTTPTTPSSSVNQPNASSTSSPSRTSDPTPSTPSSSPQTDGLRHRGSNMQSPFQMPYQQMWNMQSPQFRGQGFPQVPGGYMNQQQWLHHLQQMHMYHQQMAAGRMPSPPFMFMPPNMAMGQMGQMPFWPHPSNIGIVPGTPPPPGTPPATPPPQQQAPPPAPAAVPPQAGNEEVRMNAQGGIANDDEEENLNNDWLDKIYTLCRVGILLSIVWFYSTTGRFLTLITLLFLVYMYQWGVFQWIMRHRNGQADNQQQPQPQQPEQPQQQEGEENRNRENVDGAEENAAETLDGEQPAPPPPPPGPSVFAIAINFVSTFFTSLIPQQHDAIPGN